MKSMHPKPGQEVTYIDENGNKFTAKVTESFHDDSKKHGLVGLEYRRADRSTGKVKAVCHIEDQYKNATGNKVVCYTNVLTKKAQVSNKTTESSETTVSATIETSESENSE